MQKLRYTFFPVALLCIVILIVSLCSYGQYLSAEPVQDYDFHTVTAYCDSYNPETGWFTLVDTNGEEWVFQDNGFYAFDRPFEITYLDRDFELVSLSNNGQTETF